MAPLNPLTFYSFILLLLPPCFAQQSGWLDDPCSYSYGNFTPNSTYNSNLIQLLTNFSSIFPNNNGFYNISIGQNSDQIYGTALCRGDVRTDVCLSCVTSGARDIKNNSCPTFKAAQFYDNCMLRYSNNSILGVPDQNGFFTRVEGLTVRNASAFNDVLMTLLEGLRSKAAEGKFATGLATVPPFDTIYALVECTPDLSQTQCSSCLSQAFESIPICCEGRRGGRIFGPSCVVRFSDTLFYNATGSVVDGPSASPKDAARTTVIIVVVSIVGFMILLSTCIYICFRRKKTKKRSETMEDQVESIESLQYDFNKIKAATSNFSDENKLGQGGFGAVYKGRLDNGQEITVKRLSMASNQGDQEFKNEVQLAARLQHRNLVRLQGFCLEGKERLLIYEFVSNSSLDHFLFDPTKRILLDWGTRYKIIAGIAKGLLYLHEDSRLRIIHRDMKARMDNDSNGYIFYHYGGNWVEGPTWKYVGGKVLTRKVDPDLICLPDIMKELVDLGFKNLMIRHIYFGSQGAVLGNGLKSFVGDETILDVMKIIINEVTVEKYVYQVDSPDFALKGLPTTVGDGVRDEVEIESSEGESDGSEPVGDVVDDWESTDDELGDDIGDNRDEEEFRMNREEARKLRKHVVDPSPSFVGVSEKSRKRKPEGRSMRYKHLPSHLSLENGKIATLKKCRLNEPAASSRRRNGDGVDEPEPEPGDENLSKEDISKLYKEEEEDEAGFYVDPKHLVRVVDGEVWYKPNTREPYFEVGMLFENHLEFKDAVVKHSIVEQVNLYHFVNSSKKQGYSCNGVIPCNWRIYASKVENHETFMLKTYIETHTCGKTFRNDQLTEKVLAKHFKEKISAEPFTKPCDMVTMGFSQLNANISWDKCNRAKWKILRELEGNYKDEYAEIEAYAEYLRKVNPENTVKLMTTREKDGDPPVFQRFYVCYKVTRDGWKNGCRRIFGVDGCFLKGLAKGILVVAVGRDGNEQQFPIAWGLVESENTESWSWFFEAIKRDLDLEDGRGYTMVSDQHKAIIAAKERVFPEIEQRFCVRHVYANWQKLHKGTELRSAFWKCAKSTFFEEWEDNMIKLKELSEDAYKDLAKLPPKNWCKAFIQTHSLCDTVDNNMCESFNSCILKARCLPIISMLKWIEKKLHARNRDRNLSIPSWAGNVSPNALLLINQNVERAKHLKLFWSGWGRYQVVDNGFIHVANFNDRTCSCRVWDLTGIPCSHAALASEIEGWNILGFVSDYYKKEKYTATYSKPLECTRGREMWKNKVKERILPPPVRTQPGRPKRNRRKGKEETKKVKKGGKVLLTRAGKPVTCQICHQKGHNKRTCSNREKDPQGASQTPTSQTTQSSQKRPSTKTNAPPSIEDRPRVEVRTRNPEGIWMRQGSGTNTTATRPLAKTTSIKINAGKKSAGEKKANNDNPPVRVSARSTKGVPRPPWK